MNYSNDLHLLDEEAKIWVDRQVAELIILVDDMVLMVVERFHCLLIEKV
jgi:hypothetical protein